MAEKTTTIWAKQVDGDWTAFGTGTRRGVWAEDVSLVSDDKGSKSGSFTLRREPRMVFPDLLAGTRVRAEVGGKPVWSGRISETPTRLGGGNDGISVTLEGIQGHLDDDQFLLPMVLSDVSAGQDMRGMPGASLANAALSADGVISNDRGMLYLGFPKNFASNGGGTVGVIFDAGVGQKWKRIVIDHQEWGNDGAYLVFARASDYVDNVAGWTSPNYSDAFSGGLGASSTRTVSAGTFATARRYVHLFFYCNFNQTLSGDIFTRIYNMLLITQTAYDAGVTGTTSTLTMGDVASAAFDAGAKLLSPDKSRIDGTATTFEMPEFFSTDPRTMREYIESANAFEDVAYGVDVNDRLFVQARPTIPAATVTDSSAIEFEDTSAGSLNEINNHVWVTGTGTDGLPVQQEVASSTLDASLLEAAGGRDFSASTTGWSAPSSTITRDTGTTYNSAPTGRWDSTGASDNLGHLDTLTATVPGTFTKGSTYTARIVIWGSATPLDDLLVSVGTTYALLTATNTAAAYDITWTAIADSTSMTVSLITGATGCYFYVASIVIFGGRPTIIDRQGYRRSHQIDAGFTLTAQSAARLGETYLAGHRTTPFSGSAKVTGPAASNYMTGAPLQPEDFLVLGGELLHFLDRHNPDTGAWGRDGRIVEVTYTPATDTATLSIDNSRKSFESLLARVGVQVNQFTR